MALPGALMVSTAGGCARGALLVEPRVAEPPPSAVSEPPKIERFGVAGGLVRVLLVDGKILWAGTTRGIIRHDTLSKGHELFDRRNSDLLTDAIMSLNKVGGRLWIGTYGGGLSIFDGKSWKNYNIPEGLADAFVYGAAETPSGDVWIATWSGANRVAGGRLDERSAWSTYTVQSTRGGLPNDWVYTVDVDSQGVVWFATEGGLARYDGVAWRNWTHKDGLGAPYDKVSQGLEAVDPGQGSSHHGWQKGGAESSKRELAYNPDYIIAMLLDSRGRVLCGTWGGGLSVLRGDTFETYTTAEGLAGNYVTAIAEGADGTIWVGTSRGLSKVSKGSFQEGFVNYGAADGLYGDFVFSMVFDEKRSLWIGGIGGAVHFPRGLD